jgi:imidazole glycerol-phosphate synthase subunit HisH
MIAVLDYGMGNLHSVFRALQRVGGDAEVTDDPARVAAADALVVPGVGHFGACMRGLAHHGLDDAVRAFAASERPLFGVCVGMQVLYEGSEEDPEPGLGVLPGRVRRLPANVKVPHMGWNTVEPAEGAESSVISELVDGSFFYFVHSFAPDRSEGTVGTTTYGRTFSSVVVLGSVFATQFHPEKSGDAGLALYGAFVRRVAA